MKECDECFNMVDDDESLCEDCEEMNRRLDAEDDLDLDDIQDIEAEAEDEDDMESCTHCGNEFYPEELDGGVCYDCVDDDLEDA